MGMLTRSQRQDLLLENLPKNGEIRLTLYGKEVRRLRKLGYEVTLVTGTVSRYTVRKK